MDEQRWQSQKYSTLDSDKRSAGSLSRRKSLPSLRERNEAEQEELLHLATTTAPHYFCSHRNSSDATGVYRSVPKFWKVALIPRGLALRFPHLCNFIAAYTSSRIASTLFSYRLGQLSCSHLARDTEETPPGNRVAAHFVLETEILASITDQGPPLSLTDREVHGDRPPIPGRVRHRDSELVVSVIAGHRPDGGCTS